MDFILRAQSRPCLGGSHVGPFTKPPGFEFEQLQFPLFVKFGVHSKSANANRANALGAVAHRFIFIFLPSPYLRPRPISGQFETRCNLLAEIVCRVS